MAGYRSGGVYERLGVRRVVNAWGYNTALGASAPSQDVRDAMDEATASYVEMRELLEKSGEIIADLLGAEAAYVTSGCYAALVLSAAACLSGKGPQKMARLPDTTGMKSEFVKPRVQRYGFDRAFTVSGGTLIEVGDEQGCTAEQLEAAIGPNTAAVVYVVWPRWHSSVVSLDDAVGIAHKHNVPVIADAASQIYPLDYYRKAAQSADLACFGAKYIGAHHSAGWVCGKKEWLEAVAEHGFIGSGAGDTAPFGRAMKLDRQEIIGVVTALEAWFSMNHEDRLLGYDRKLEFIQRGLKGLLHVETKVDYDTDYHYQPVGFIGPALRVIVDTKALRKSLGQINKELAEGDPRIWVNTHGDDTLGIHVHTLFDGEENILVDSLRSVLTT